MKLWHSFEELLHVVIILMRLAKRLKFALTLSMCKMTSRSVKIGQLNENINGPTTNLRWSTSKTRAACLMIVVESSYVLGWPLHAPTCSFSVIRIT